MSKPILPVLTILAALFICVKANSYSEADMPYCLADSTNTTCSDFQTFPVEKGFYSLAGDESLSLLQTKAILAKPKRRRRKPKRSRRVISNEERSRSTRVFLTNKTLPKIRKWKAATAVRPLWQKTLRCSGPTMDDCEECVGKVNCWGDCKRKRKRKVGDRGKGIDRCVHVDAQNKWTRFVTVIHVRCEMSMAVKFRPAKISGGAIKIYWDDKFVEKGNPGPGNFTEKSEAKFPWPKFWQANLRTKHKGANTFMVEFVVPPNSKGAVGKFNDLMFKMVSNYATCLDTKSCLHTLKDEADLPLRTSSALMHQCLKTGMDMVLVKSVANSCTKWKACLNRTDPSGEYQDRLLTMLEASGAATPTTAQVSLKQGLVPQGAATCIYPPQEDPLSWNCDCYEQMLQRCKAIGALEEVALCIRSQFCAFPDTCQHWKDMACNQQPVADMRDRLRAALPQTGSSTSPFSTLTSRASQQDMKATLAPDLDHTTGHKACA
eukprot:gnl/TRDRNA2_/TRDRNA2_176392_c0_seq38.p1 gnl/TRDRNA2_/TRDRNA2_176392_c0~~gnl/TRDRNA2_/TRDRNA2_176392_c0_seq38.p1  ORF type:complete len:491 (-),score=62.93 gnl/TRDRNA2_/TRDRNA2_176392_c0_seq38:48-1520(-)